MSHSREAGDEARRSSNTGEPEQAKKRGVRDPCGHAEQLLADQHGHGAFGFTVGIYRDGR